jgi:hypothetical protein
MLETPEAELALPEPVDPWAHIAEGLRQVPREWRRITGHPATTVATTNITRGVLAAFRPAGCYEAVRRDGELFVRYLGTLEDIDRRVGELKGGLG